MAAILSPAQGFETDFTVERERVLCKGNKNFVFDAILSAGRRETGS